MGKSSLDRMRKSIAENRKKDGLPEYKKPCCKGASMGLHTKDCTRKK